MKEQNGKDGKKKSPFKTRLLDHKTVGLEGEVEVPNVPAEDLFDMMADVSIATSLFSAVKQTRARLLEESHDGNKKKWELESLAEFKFLKFSSVGTNHFIMETDKEARTMSCTLRQKGELLKAYSGTWQFVSSSKPAGCGGASFPLDRLSASSDGSAEPPSPCSGSGSGCSTSVSAASTGAVIPHPSAAASGSGCVIRISIKMQPTKAPPPPVNQVLKVYLAGEIKRTVKDLLDGVEPWKKSLLLPAPGDDIMLLASPLETSELSEADDAKAAASRK